MNIKQAKILIVEDEPQINRLVELVLISGGFCNIKKAFDGIEALELIKKDKPDLILLDVMIPEINGFDLCKIIKNDIYLKSIQVIMLTAKKMEEDILKGFESGAIDYILKPFSNKILLARIKAHLLNTSSENENKSIKIDDLKKTVTLFDRQIDLTRFEFEILKILLSSKGVVFSRSQLLN
ncbi:MAG: response regulator, partial [Candidatus Gastranaerophilales bacterium]|nr:response regulator [Candidatus Gastranaerophilales bacterium]